MKNARGFKEMLRDRCPEVVNYALKWQKAKERWIEHTYGSFVRPFIDKDERKHTTRILLGISKKFRQFNFHNTIDWDNLTDEDTEYWNRVESWVDWFQTNYMYVENTYIISHNAGRSDFQIKVEIINNYLCDLLPEITDSEKEKQIKYDYVDKFVDFLFNCLHGKI